MTGPLEGVRVLEVGGIGPVPFAGMLLADLGADVLRIEAPGDDSTATQRDLLNRGKRTLTLDLKSESGRDRALRASAHAHLMIEGFRPGVMERLGLGPSDCQAEHAALIYGRMSGWGSSGPLAQTAGHDINYIALSGALHGIGSQDGPPVPPLAYVGDFGGGAMSFVVGLLAALLHARETGQGQVVDASILDGAALLTLPIRTLLETGRWAEGRGSNLLDGGAPFYGVYETSDSRHISIGPLEPSFFAELMALLGLESHDVTDQYDRDEWPRLRRLLETVFRSRTRDEWVALLEGTDVCFAPVLTLREAEGHPHNIAHGTFIEVDGVVQPAPTPRFSGTPASTPRPPDGAAEDGRYLHAWGLSRSQTEKEIA